MLSISTTTRRLHPALPRFPPACTGLHSGPLLYLGLCALSPAVSSCSGDPSGIWLISVEAGSQDETCTQSITHNFTDAREYEEDPDSQGYTSQQSTELSDWLAFAIIQVDGKDQAILVVGGQVYPGYSTSSSTWVFQWVESQTDSRVDEHPAGYDYSEDAYTEITYTWNLDFSGKSFSGTMEENSYYDTIYSESDTWSDELAAEIGGSGQVPAGTYLEVEKQGPKTSVWQAASNDYNSEDCDNVFCELRVEDACQGSRSTEGRLVDFGDQEAYDAIKDSQQAPGLD